MSPKFNSPRLSGVRKPRGATSAVITEQTPSATTHEGGPGYAGDAKSEVFLLAVANMVSEDTFYESGDQRDTRFQQLMHQVAVEDPDWTQHFLGWLRNDANMRSAALVGALEAARAMVAAKIPGGRQIVASVLRRPDEPGEALAYWLGRYGRKIPMPIKRGIADGALSNYSEFSLLKYDTASHAVRFGDVIEIAHPDPESNRQSDLFRHALDRRHNRDNPIPDGLVMLAHNKHTRDHVANGDADWLLDTDLLKKSGMTWEDALSLAGPGVDKAKLWEALIPTMGYMALLRNLRNFDQAGISGNAMIAVGQRLADHVQVARSKQFPFRFLSAHRAVGSLQWGQALEIALGHSLANVPALTGRTLVLVDRSGSMFTSTAGSKSGLNRADTAAVFGAALALRNPGGVDLVEFGTNSAAVRYRKGDSLLRVVDERFHSMGGTDTAGAVQANYAGHDRVVIVTDEQAYWHHRGDPAQMIPAHVPLYTWNLGGYQFGQNAAGPNRHVFGGLTDAAFRMIPLLEAGTSTGWPWEH